jgi:signal transduction histidine kinase
MSIRRKLIVSNIFMIVIPVVVAMITLSIFIMGPGAQSWETMENLFRDNDGVYTAQSLMQTLELRGDIKATEKEMAAAGYHFMISVDGETEYSNMTLGDVAAAKRAIGAMYDDRSNCAITKDGISFVRYDSADDGYTALAVHTREIPPAKGSTSYMERYIALYVGTLVLIIVGSVTFLNIMLSCWIVKNILKPLKQLSTCSELIREGRLDFELTSAKKDEMGEMIRGFDEMRRHLQTSVEERMEYEQYRKELINGISHDLRTPLTSIRGYVEGLRDGIADTAEKKKQYYEAIETSVKGLDDLVDNLTNFSRVEMGESHLEMAPLNVTEYLRGVIRSMRDEYRKDNVTFTARLPEKAVMVLMDRREMDRVFRNLIDNTIKYRTKNSSVITIAAAETEHHKIEIRVGDDGPGVDDQDLRKIFTCFYRGNAARTFPSGGSGIGLAVVKQLVSQQGGTVYAQNSHGLVIVMEMPIWQGEAHGKQESVNRGRRGPDQQSGAGLSQRQRV